MDTEVGRHGVEAGREDHSRSADPSLVFIGVEHSTHPDGITRQVGVVDPVSRAGGDEGLADRRKRSRGRDDTSGSPDQACDIADVGQINHYQLYRSWRIDAGVCFDEFILIAPCHGPAQARTVGPGEMVADQ